VKDYEGERQSDKARRYCHERNGSLLDREFSDENLGASKSAQAGP
jgi:hypothetical protein